MASTKSFKRYSRESRVQYSEEIYNSGMQFSSNPLPEGFSKELINFDIASGGDGLKPRPGLRLEEVIVGEAFVTEDNKTQNIVTTTEIKHPKEYTKVIQQTIVGAPKDEKVPNTQLYKGNLYSDHNEDGVPWEFNFGSSAIGGTQVVKGTQKEYKRVDLLANSGLENPYTFFKEVGADKVHGIPLEADLSTYSHIGTKAYNNNYFFFAQGDGDEFALLQSKFDEDEDTYVGEVVDIYQENPTEAVANGYNMLRKNPYTFEDESVAGTSIMFHGVIPYIDESHSTIATTPSRGQKLYLRCYYRSGSGASSAFKYRIVWEWQAEGSSDWNLIKRETITRSSGDPVVALTAELNTPGDNIRIRITAFNLNSEDQSDPEIEHRLIGYYSFNKENYGDMYNAEYKKYNLHLAEGMGYWKNRLVVFGVPEDKHLLFLSEVNNPGYFPYPQSAEIFDEPIIAVQPLLDSLLVFTRTELHMMTLNPDGFSWTKQCIQRFLNISETDTNLILAVKNMVYFKSGNYYYMVVPRLNSLTGELTIAPISRNIQNYLDNFSENVYNTLNMLYNYDKDTPLVNYYSFLDFEDILNMYVFKIREGVYLHFCLIYNSVARHWRVHCYEHSNWLKLYKADATQRGKYISLMETWHSGEDYVTGYQVLGWDKTNLRDAHVPRRNTIVVDDEVSYIQALNQDKAEIYRLWDMFNNYQLMDTGYREIETDLKKRFREIQFKINNVSQNTLRFYTEIYIDGDLRREAYKYSVESIEKSDGSKVWGELQYNKELLLINETVMTGATALAEDNEDINTWTLDVSQFPEVIPWKIRIPLSGKGYSPRVLFISKNLQEFELLNNSFVFRILNSR